MRTIQQHFALMVVAGILPVMGGAGLAALFQYREDRAMLEASIVSTARALAGAMSDRFDGLQAALATLSQSPTLKTGDLRRFYDEATVMRDTERADAVLLIAPDGQPLVNTRRPFGSEVPNVRGTGQLKALQVGRPVVNDLFFAPLARVSIFSVGVPVTRDGIPTHALVASLNPNKLREILVRQKLPPDWVATVLDSKGIIVARTRDHEKFLGTPASPDVVRRIAELPEGSLSSVTVDGIEVISAFSRSMGSDWSVVIGVPRGVLEASARRTFALLLGWGLLLSVLVGWASWSLGRRVVHSIDDLSRLADATGQGQAPHPQPASFRETARLTMAFRAVGHALQEANAALSAKEEELRRTLESANDGIVSLPDGVHIGFFNAAAELMFGYPRAEVAGKPLSLLVPEGIPTAGGTPVVSGRRRDGSEFRVELSISAAPQSGAGAVTVIMRDVTERERLHAALLRSNLDLRQFAFVASHDLRSPLRSIRGFLELLLRRHGAALDRDGRQLAERAVGAASEMDKLTVSLLTYAQLESGTAPRGSVDSNEVAQTAIGLLHSVIEESSARVELQPLPVVQGDRQQLIQLFQNLLGNAVKFCRGRAPDVRVSVRRGAGEWMFSVADNGIGIEERHHLRIFDIFKRLHSQSEYPGVGMGLAVCKRVVEHHGGRIWVESAAGVGTTFHFTIADSGGQT